MSTRKNCMNLLCAVCASVVRLALLGLAVGLALTAFQNQALAYTDPGTGALIWQMAAAAVVGAAFYFRRFLSWIKGKKANPAQTASEKESSANANDRKN